jgi:hypothetical protein
VKCFAHDERIMDYEMKSKNGTTITRVACAVFFLLFSFIYLFYYQDNLLYVLQHTLSKGSTTYNRAIGAVLIVVLLWLVHALLVATTRLRLQAYALTYFPSFLLLGVLCDVGPDGGASHYPGNWVWLLPLLLLLYAGVVWVCRQLESIAQQNTPRGIFSRSGWGNMLLMVLMALMTGCIGNNNDLLHFQAKMENQMRKGHYDKALEAGRQSLETDSTLTLLRVWALSEEGRLGEALFTYPLVGKSDALLPNGHSVRLLLLNDVELYRHLGVYFKQKMRPRQYLEKLHERHFATKAAHDWLLCAYLLDGSLDKFVKVLPRYYQVNDSLPTHYREALILYTHLKEHPAIVYHDTVMDADFEDWIQLSRKYSDKTEQNSMLRDSYGKTYWYYYKTIHN